MPENVRFGLPPEIVAGDRGGATDASALLVRQRLFDFRARWD